MGRLRLAISFHDNPSRDYVLTMNVLLAACAGVVAAMYLAWGWWSAGAAVAVALVLELALRSRYTAWLSIVVGTAASAGAGALGAAAVAISFTAARGLWWTAAVLGGLAGAALMIDAHRRLARR